MMAAQQIFLGTSQSNAEEEMYKEMVESIQAYFAGTADVFDDSAIRELGLRIAFSTIGVNNNAPDTRKIILRNCEKISRANVFFGNTVGGEIYLPALKILDGSQQFQSSLVTKVDMPVLETVTNFSWMFCFCSKLKTVNLGRVTNISYPVNTSFSGCTALTDVYITSMSSSTLLSYTGMLTTPTGTYYTPTQVVFHCSDGDVAWDGSAWVKQTA